MQRRLNHGQILPFVKELEEIARKLSHGIILTSSRIHLFKNFQKIQLIYKMEVRFEILFLLSFLYEF